MRDSKTNYNRIAELHINKIDETVGVYAAAFLDAATKVFEHGLCDFAPYPGMYCLRHGLELFVKQMTVYRAYEMRDKSLLYRKGHGLLVTWEEVKPHIEECIEETALTGGDELDSESISRVDETIRYLNHVDPGGMLYRYPEDIVKGKGRVDTHFPEDRVDLAMWAKRAEDLASDCQQIEDLLGMRCNFIQSRRKEYGDSLYDIVAGLSDKDGL